MTPLEQAIAKLEQELNWRGPNDRRMGHIVLPRALAEAMLAKLKEGKEA